tara:strand:+ start:2515 stop:3309 length:795 start_codon:yes stop_codon:yes gene_type:complete
MKSKESFENSQDDKWKVIYNDESEYQTINILEKDDKFALVLNNEIQVHSDEYKISHYIQCSIPVKKYKPKSILILGGGDLLAASFCLKYDFVEKVKVVEIDEKVVDMVKKNLLFKEITNKVYEDPRLVIEIQDALSFIRDDKETYDMIIEDIEIDFTKQETNMKISDFITYCMNKSPIYVGSIPDHKIKKNSSILKISEMKKKEYFNIENKHKVLKELNFNTEDLEKLKSILKKYDISVAAYDYISEYGKEAYLMIHKKQIKKK